MNAIHTSSASAEDTSHRNESMRSSFRAARSKRDPWLRQCDTGETASRRKRSDWFGVPGAARNRGKTADPVPMTRLRQMRSNEQNMGAHLAVGELTTTDYHECPF